MVAVAKPKGNRTIAPQLGAMLGFALSRQLPEKVEEWQATLSKNEVTAEMVAVFVAFGWLSSSQDPRISKDTLTVIPAAASGQTELPKEAKPPKA